MVKPLPLSDFRATRRILEDEDYALGGEDVLPTDLIDEEIWHGIMDLPDDIAVRISNHHGTFIKMLYDLHYDWIVAVGDPEHPDNLFGAMLDAADCLQCSTFDFLHGYYRSAISNLRSALELTMIGAYGNCYPNDDVFRRWLANGADLTFPSCTKRFRTKLKGGYNSMFAARGWLEQFYYELCNFAHSRPNSSDGSLWESNGPVYNDRAIRLVEDAEIATYGIGYLLVKVARPDYTLSDRSKMLFEATACSRGSKISAAYKAIFSRHTE